MVSGFHGDWYWVEPIDAQTFAIGEPKYEQQNWSYLLIGEHRALLFDTGSFFGDITTLVPALTDKPLTVLPSHMHFDHLGNVTRFDHVAVADLEELRTCCIGDRLTPKEALFLGAWEDRDAPTFRVAEWLEIGSKIDLGGRRVQLLHTPGHSMDSVSLWEADQTRLFGADFLYPGGLLADIPGASLAAYLKTAERLIDLCPETLRIFAAHSDLSSEDLPAPPVLGFESLTALRACLSVILAAPRDLGTEEVREVAVTDTVWLVYDGQALVAAE